MRALSGHLLVRVVAIALVLWVNADIGFCSACASDLLAAGSSDPSLVSGGTSHDGRPDRLPHPTHCFYHAQWVELSSPVMLTNSARQSGTVGETTGATPEILTHTLDHPPRLAI